MYIRSDKGLTLETSSFQVFHSGNSTFINSFDKTICYAYNQPDNQIPLKDWYEPVNK